MKRILITNGHLNVGGVEKSLINFLHSVDYSQYEVDLLLFEGLGDYLEDIPKEVNIILCDLTGTYGPFSQVLKNNLKSPKVIYQKAVMTFAGKKDKRAIRFLRRSGQYDIAIAYRVGTPMDYVSYGVKAKRKYFWWHHGEFDYPDSLVHSWQQAASNMDGMMCVSESIKKVVEPYFQPFIKNIAVIPNSLNIPELYRKSEEGNPFQRGETSIVSVGRFSAEKHMADCVTVAKKLLDSGYDFRWYLIGNGAEWDKIQSLIHEMKMDKYIICTGSLNNPYPYIKNADLLVHPSYVESQGLTVLESMALGQLTVCVNSDGVSEFAEDGRNAVVAQKNTDSLYQAVIEAIALDDKKAAGIKEQAKETAEQYSCNIIWNRIEELLLEGE